MGLVAIYVNRKGQQLGPYDSNQINRLLLDGELSPDDLGWHKGMQEWVALGQLEALVTPVKGASSPHIAAAASSGPVRGFATSHIAEGDPRFQAVGTAWYLLALILGVIGTPLCLYALPRLEYTLTIAGSMLLIAAFGYGFLGNGVRKNRRWAQPASTIGAIILLPFFPFGTMMGLYMLGMLKKAQERE